MAWTTFPTLTDGQVLTGAHMQLVRDNFAETAPAKATSAGSFFAGTGTNTIAERIPTNTVVPTSDTTTSTSYTALASAGPAVTVTTGVKALVFISAQTSSSASTLGVFMSYAVSGATTVSSTDTNALVHYSASGGLPIQATRVVLQGLTAGSNTFTAQYKVAGATTGTWSQRNLTVVPF